MSPIVSVLAVAGLASLAAASPLAAPEVNSRSFSVNQVPSSKVVRRSGAIEIQKTFKKFNKAVPEDVATAASAAAAAEGSVTANPEQYDSEYLAPVSVGGTTLNLDFDTGSSDLWVFSSELPASERAGHSIYTVNSAKIESGETWNINYGDGSGARGNVYADTVVIGTLLTFCI